MSSRSLFLTQRESTEAFGSESDYLPSLDFEKFKATNERFLSIPNSVNKNSSLCHYYFAYCVDPVIIISVISFSTFLYGVCFSIASSSVQYTVLGSALFLKVPVGLYNYFGQGSKSLNVGIGALWYFGLIVNVLAAITELFRGIYCCVQKWCTNKNNKHVTFSFNQYDYGSIERRKNRWGFEFLYIDLFMTLELFPKLYKSGLWDSIIILDEALDWKQQLTEKKRPLTIVTLGNPLFVVESFDIQNGEEDKQYEFARNYLLFAQKDAQTAKFLALSTKEVATFCVKWNEIRIGEDLDFNPIYDTVIRFREPVQEQQHILIYSTVKFIDPAVFFRNLADRFNFVKTLQSFHNHLTINRIIKRILKKNAFNVYRGRICAHYLIKSFPEIRFIIKRNGEHDHQQEHYELYNAATEKAYGEGQYYMYLFENDSKLSVKDVWPPKSFLKTSSPTHAMVTSQVNKIQSNSSHKVHIPLPPVFGGTEEDYPTFVVY